MVARAAQCSRRFGFTLIELLAVVVIISLLATLTLSAYRAIAGDSRMSMAANMVQVAMSTARSLAIEENSRTMVVFRPVLTGPESQQMEVVIAVESLETHLNPFATIQTGFYGETEMCLGLRFTPAVGQEPRLLPKGMMIAVPAFYMASVIGDPDTQAREEWMSPSFLPGMGSDGVGEAAGVLPAIVFDRSGTMRTSFTDTGSQIAFVDFNGDGRMECNGDSYSLLPPSPGSSVYDVPDPGPDGADYTCVFGNEVEATDLNLNYCYSREDEEPYVLIAPYFALFDFDEAREEYQGETLWSSPLKRLTDLDSFVRAEGRVFHFNRFSGVLTK